MQLIKSEQHSLITCQQNRKKPSIPRKFVSDQKNLKSAKTQHLKIQISKHLNIIGIGTDT
jgi:hypothetical protein